MYCFVFTEIIIQIIMRLTIITLHTGQKQFAWLMLKSIPTAVSLARNVQLVVDYIKPVLPLLLLLLSIEY